MESESKEIGFEDMEFEVLPELTPEEAQKMEEEHRNNLKTFYSQSKKYSIEEWYPQLKQFTFESHCFSLTNVEAYLLNLIYQQNYQKLELPVIKKTKQNLIQKVDAFLKQWFPEGCFFRLSTRSPKDYGWRYQSSQSNKIHQQQLYKRLAGLKISFGKELINEIYLYFLQQSKKKIKITSGEQFVEVFSHSQRIQIDITDLMYLNERVSKQMDDDSFVRADETLLNVWGRKWVQFEWMQQFRCFFYNYKLTAICQYDQRCYFREIQPRQQEIKDKLCQYFKSMIPNLAKIGMSSGVMDIIVKLNNSEISVQLIEVNVFNTNSRASLFSWRQERKLLEEGPLEFRFHKQPIGIGKWQLIKMMGMMERGIEAIIEPVMAQLGYLQEWKLMQ